VPHDWTLDGLGYHAKTGGTTVYRGKNITQERRYWCTGKNDEKEEQ
jgi:hypothetical protein